MRNFKKALLFLMAVTISVATVFAAMRGQSRKGTTSNKKEDATPIQEGVMTERQKQHSKLYQRSGGRNLRNIGKSLVIVIPPPFIEPDDEKTPPTIEELLQRITCNADAVVVGTVTNKTSQLTEDGSFVFTDYDMQVEEIIKNTAQTSIQPSDNIVITRSGGAVQFNGKVIRAIDKSSQPLETGSRYLLSLQRIASSDDYRTLNTESSFELDQNHVRRLTTKHLPYPFPYESDANSFLAHIRARANLCDSKSKGGEK